MNKSDSINELAAAMAKAQGQIENAAKDAANPFFKSKYADLASCWDACRKALSSNGLSVIQLPSYDGTTVTVATMLTHSSGQWISEDLQMPTKEQTPQAIGSTITYARRYSLCAMVGVAPEDDDGNAGSGRAENHKQAPPQNGAGVKDSEIPAELKPWFVKIRKDRNEIPAAYTFLQSALSQFEGGIDFYERTADAFQAKYPKGAPTAAHEAVMLSLWEALEGFRKAGA